MDGDLDLRLKRVIVEQLPYSLKISDIRTDTSLYGKGLGLNSIDIMSLIVRLEDEFDIFFEADEVEATVGTFGTLVSVVERKLSEENGFAADEA